jgi:methylated-DNA-[protein]-cysteine S-methyltransferase
MVLVRIVLNRREGGRKMSKGFAVYETQLGSIRVEYEDDKVIFIKKTNTDIDHKGRPTALTDAVYQELTEYFEGKRERFDFPYELRGTVFQKKVWQALCDIPYGETRTYKEIATAVGNPKAYRAVGMANNKNPIMIVVPCHRVIGTDSKLTGYAGGIEMKKELLNIEGKNSM